MIFQDNYQPQKKISNQAIKKDPQRLHLAFVKNSLAVLILGAIQSLSVCSAEGLDITETGDKPSKTLVDHSDGNPHEYDYINIVHAPLIDWNQHTISISNKSTLKVLGNVDIAVTASRCPDETAEDLPSNAGNYALTVKGGSTAELLGDVNILVTQDYQYESSHGHGDDLNEIGANGVYAEGAGSTISIGSENTSTRIWTIAVKPDSISAKDGGQVALKSTSNQIVGSMDLVTTSVGGEASKISGIFSGSDSYWYGDEYSSRNLSALVLRGLDQVGSMGDSENPITLADGELDLTFTNGAQWSYLGNAAVLTEDQVNGLIDKYADKIPDYLKGVLREQLIGQDATTKKRVSSITLRDGGIINLYDADLEQTWKNIRNETLGTSLYDALAQGEGFDMTHDYVRIGDLKGAGGIFRIDTNGQDKSQTDLIFVEDSTEGGTHHIQIEGLNTLNGITEDNTLTFALVSQTASNAGVAFHEIENVEGDKLFNYELDIRAVDFTAEDAEAIKSQDEFADSEGDSEKMSSILEDYFKDEGAFANGGERWEIYRVVRSNSASTLGMIGSGYAGYDLAVEMDRRDRRIHEAVLENGADKGLWVRMNHGQMGASGVYKNDVDTVTIGFEGAPSASSRFGGWFSYATGDVDYSNVKGSADLTRYEAALYGTLLSGNHYLDLVGRFGRVKNEFDVSSNSGAIRTTGDYDQDYAALSAEYGYTLRDASTGVFLEPQLQIQVAYLRDFDYSTERGMRVHADAETSVIGRAGFRFGRQFRTAASVGEAYLRGDVLHQWTDGQQAVLKADADRISTVWGDKDTWADFGVGAFWNWKDRFSLQLDLERTVGGETVDTWQMSGRASLLF